MRALVLDSGPLLLPLRRQNGRPLGCLRIGVVVEDQSIPQWQKELIEWLTGIEGFEIVGIGSTGRLIEAPKSSRIFEFIHQQSSRKYDPFREVPLPRVAGSISFQAQETAAKCDVCATSEVAAAHFDIVIWLSPHRNLDSRFASQAKFGVISFQLGRNRSVPPYFDEVAEGDLLSSASIWWWHADDFGRIRKLRTAQVATDQGLAFTANAAQPLVALAQMAASVCLDILQQGDDWLRRAMQIPGQSLSVITPQVPSDRAVASFVVRKMVRSLRCRLRHHNSGWFAALRRNDSRSYVQSGCFSPEGLREIGHPPRSRIADPFLVECQGKTFLYFEEVPPGRIAGRVSCAEVQDDGSIADARVVLEDESNLSYPCVFPHEGDYFMIPETGERRTVNLFRATRMPYEYKLETTYLDDIALSDTTPVLVDGTWYFFTTTYEPFMQTLLFWSDRVDGKWRLHPKSPVSCSAENCRSAGAIKMVRGRLLRPTQDCSVRYGYAIVINEIVRLTRTEFEERQIDRLLPTWGKGLLGTHTWNISSRFEVFDALRLV